MVIDIRELFLDVLSIVKFELKFYKDKESPMFERIVKTRVFQQKLQRLKDFIMSYFEIMYKDQDSPINKAALQAQLDNIARITNYYNDLSSFYSDHTKQLITKDKVINLIEYSHIEVLFLIFTNILDWEHYKSSLLFPTDKSKEKLLKEFLEKLSSVLDVDNKLFKDEINNYIRIKNEHNKIKGSYIYVNTNFRRTTQPIFVLAFMEGRRLLAPAKKSLMFKSKAHILKSISKMVRKHYLANDGELPIWGEIDNYVYHHFDGKKYVYSSDGHLLDDAHEIYESRATLSLK